MNTKLDLNSIIGFLLVGAIIIYITVFDQPSKEAEAAAAKEAQVEQVEESKTKEAELGKVLDLEEISDTLTESTDSMPLPI